MIIPAFLRSISGCQELPSESKLWFFSNAMHFSWAVLGKVHKVLTETVRFKRSGMMPSGQCSNFPGANLYN
eukprot:1502050-Amphidinium_carterae.1